MAIGDIDEARAKETAAELGVKVVTRLDVTDPDSFKDFLDLVEGDLGPLDVLIDPEPARADTTTVLTVSGSAQVGKALQLKATVAPGTANGMIDPIRVYAGLESAEDRSRPAHEL